MTHPEFMHSMRSLHVLLNELGLLQQVYTTQALRPSGEFVSYALSDNPQYAVLYRLGLRNRDYNFLLNDYSYLQFGHAGGNDDLSLRFGFYANPFGPVPNLADLFDGADYEMYLQLLEDQDEVSSAMAVRYDVALRDYIELRHPAAHLHIGLDENSRWPVDKILSPLAFTLWMLKLFYPDQWADSHDDRLSRAKSECQHLGGELFSPRERDQLYFT